MKQPKFSKKLKLVPLFIFLFIGGVALGAILYSNVITQQITLHSMETRMDLTLIGTVDSSVYNGDNVSAQVRLQLIDEDFIDTPFRLKIAFEHENTQPNFANGDIVMQIEIKNASGYSLFSKGVGEGTGNVWDGPENTTIVETLPTFFTTGMGYCTISDEFQGYMELYIYMDWFFGPNSPLGVYDLTIQVEEV